MTKRRSVHSYYIAIVLLTLCSVIALIWYATFVVAAAFPEQDTHHVIRSLVLRLALFGLLVTTLIAFISFRLYRQVSRPLQEMREGAHRFARGQFERKLPSYEIEEIDDLAFTMNSMGEQLQRLEQVRSDFVSNVSHELKTPVTSIKGFVETLIDGAAENAKDRKRFLEIISKQSERLTRIIDDLLTLSRLETERVEELFQFQEEQVRDLIEAVVELSRPRAGKKQIELFTHCGAELTARMDRSLMEQAILNLVENAIKYSAPGSRIWIGAEVEGSHVNLYVRDEGPGIPAEHLSRLFERFYRVDKARSRDLGGTGLGLAIVKHVLGAHSGTVSVRSRVGVGSTFTLHLPV